MAVFTEVSHDEAADLLRLLQLGELTHMAGCAGGIENTNYFVSTTRDGATHDYVLTLFERLNAEQLPFYLHLMKHLAERGMAVPDPAADAQGRLVHHLKGKPATVVNKLPGSSELQPQDNHCAQVGHMLAQMHLAGASYERYQPHLRGLSWWNETVPVVRPHLEPAQTTLLNSELAYQHHVAQSPAYAALPQGPIHADLFRDNVLFHKGQLSGFFDFYFAGHDTWLFDVAVCLNDWCIDLTSGAPEATREAALLQAYNAVRPLTAQERQLLPAMKRAGALRFWISRLWDWHLPREASMLQPHNPSHFERVLRQRLHHL